VDEKLGRSQLTKAAQSRIDVGDIKALAGALSFILDVFQVRRKYLPVTLVLLTSS